jgi:predicted DNA-binding transcriptional regulator AlpA
MKLLTEEEAAAFLRCSRKTLYRMRKQGTGPKWMRMGCDGGIRYAEQWLEEYAEAQAGGKNEPLQTRKRLVDEIHDQRQSAVAFHQNDQQKHGAR